MAGAADAVFAFVKNKGCVKHAKAEKKIPDSAIFTGQKSSEIKRIRREPRGHQGGNGRAGAGNRAHTESGFTAGPHKQITGIGHQWRACV